MRILVTGASGLVGSALTAFLGGGGHDVVRLGRQKAGESNLQWDPDGGRLDARQLEGFDAVVHLAGENIAARRWSAKQKQRILDSRVKSTTLLAETLARLERKPQVLICASAIGYYGDRGDEPLTEESAPGSGFLPDVCRQWEAATAAAEQSGIRVVNTRFGVILSAAGGALTKMLLPFKLFVGGRIGNGRQYMSWITLDDAIGVIHHALTNDQVLGPINAVAPQPVTNLQFTKTLGRVLRRPTVFPLPAFMARLMLGEMANELLLASARVLPQKLQATGYRFRHSELEDGLRRVLGRT